jgi:O-antigen ligase
MIDKLFIAFFAILPFSNFLFKKVNIWHAQGQFFQVGLLVLFCASFFEKSKYTQSVNKPLGLFLLWSGLTTAYHWIDIIAQTNNYPVKLFFPFFNLLCAVILYRLCVEYLDKEKIGKILKYFSYSVIILLFYCVLQYLQLDEFFKGISGNQDELVGTIGNKSHLSGYLALCQPLFFEKKIVNILALILLWLIIFIAGSVSGLCCGFAILLFYLFFKKKWVYFTLILSSILSSGIYLFVKCPYFFTSSHRVELWMEIFQKLRLKAITGYGLGYFETLKIYIERSVWRHFHNEYLQVVFEIGVIGLALLCWLIWDYFKNFRVLKTDLSIRLASMFFGYCILALFTFNAHLWILSGIGVMSYSFLYCLRDFKPQILGA